MLSITFVLVNRVEIPIKIHSWGQDYTEKSISLENREALAEDAFSSWTVIKDRFFNLEKYNILTNENTQEPLQVTNDFEKPSLSLQISQTNMF